MSDTPETDDIARGNHVVPTEWAQQLERERDEAREGLAEEIKFHHRTHSDLVHTQCQMQDFIRERDEARDALAAEIKHHTETTAKWNGHHMDLTIAQCDLNKALRERDEAREELHDIRINLGDDAEGYTLLHAVCVM
jgi:hypothetical protein